MNKPVLITVTPHPHLASRFTHLVAQRDALARGWLCFSDVPLGVWPSREAAKRTASRLQAKGVVMVNDDRRRA